MLEQLVQINVLLANLRQNIIMLTHENEELRIKPDENSGIKWIEIDKLEDSGIESKMVHTYRKLIAKAKKM
jgi:hypothetical protein